MGWQAWATGALLLAMMATLFTGRFGPDIVLLGVLVAMLLMGIVEPAQAVTGFSNTGVITIALLYVVAAGLKETGAMAMLSQRMLGRPKTEAGARARMVLPVAGMSAFVNNTPIVAMFLPVLDGWAKKNNIAPSRLFLPLSYAAVLGGVCTLIGTSTNLVVAGLLAAHNRDLVAQGRTPEPEFGMFTISTVGVPIAIMGALYLVFAARWLLPTRGRKSEGPDSTREYTTAMQVGKGSPVIGQTIEQAGLRGLPGLFLSRVERTGEAIVAVGPGQKLEEGDVLVFVGRLESIVDLQRIKGLHPVAEGEWSPLALRQINRLLEVVIAPSSALVGQSIRECGFRSRYGAVVVAAHRHGARLRGKLGDIVLRAGDTLLVEAPSGWAETHGDSGSFYLVSEVPDSTPPRHERAWAAILILIALMTTVTFGWLDIMVAAMTAAGAMVALRCCTG
ncbi:MAG: SLC13 family permease, partial [Phycisphaerales bacterium]